MNKNEDSETENDTSQEIEGNSTPSEVGTDSENWFFCETESRFRHRFTILAYFDDPSTFWFQNYDQNRLSMIYKFIY